MILFRFSGNLIHLMRNSLMVKVVSGSGTLEKCSKYVTLKFHLQLEGNFNCLAESLN